MSKKKPEALNMRVKTTTHDTSGLSNSNVVIDQGFIDLVQTDVSKKYRDENLRDLTYSSYNKDWNICQ